MEEADTFHEINLLGGKPWGFSLSGGSEYNCPLKIGKVKEGSKASQCGLREEDVLLSVAEEECLSQGLAVSLIQKAHDQLTLIVQRGTLDSSMMKTGDYHQQQGIPEGSENLGKQHRFIKREDRKKEGLEKSKDSAVNRRIKKHNSQSSAQRPKSWHNTGTTHSHSSSFDGSSQGTTDKGNNYVNVQDSGSPTEDSYVSDIQKKSLEQFEKDPSANSNNEGYEISPGFVKRRVLNYANSFNEEDKIKYELQPAIIYPQVVSAMQVQNSQAGMMPNGSSSPPYTQTGVGVANYSAVQMPQKQYASTAEIYGGEAKVPPPLPTRVDSKNRTQQLSEHHVKSSSWPATKPQTSSTTDTPTQSSVISPTNLPPVKLSPSQEQVYPSSQQSGSGRHYSSGQRVPATVSASSDFKLCMAQPVVIDEENATVTEDWFQAPKEGHPPSLSTMWQPSNSSLHCPPSPPTRDIDPESSIDRRGPRFNTDDSLFKSYEAFLSEFEKQDSAVQVNKMYENISEAPAGTHMNEQRDGSPRLSRTTPVKSSASFSSEHQGDTQIERKLQRQNSLSDKLNERTWKNPNDFSATVPVSGSMKVQPSKDIDSSKEVEVLLAEPPKPERPNTEWSLRGNAPRNRTPINLTLMAAVDHKGESKGRTSPKTRDTSSPRTREVPAQSLSSEDQRKLEQISSGNSILSMLQRDRQKMSFYGVEDFGKRNGPEVASDQADPLSPMAHHHHRQRSYDFPSGRSLEPNQRNHLYSSASALNQSATLSISNSTSIPEEQGTRSSRSRHSRYHSLGSQDYEVPDVSMETKLPVQQEPPIMPDLRTDRNQPPMPSTPSERVLNLVIPDDRIHSASDTEQSSSRTSRQRHHKRSDPQLEGGGYRSSRKHELSYQRRSPASSRSSSNTSWSSSGSNRSFSGDHYSSTSSLASSGRGQTEHRQGRYSDVGKRSSPRSSPVEMTSSRLPPKKSSSSSVSRSSSMNVMPVSNLGVHNRTNSYDDHNSSHQQANSPLQVRRGMTENWKKNEQPQIPERSHSTLYMESRRHTASKSSPEAKAAESRVQAKSAERLMAAAAAPATSTNTTPPTHYSSPATTHSTPATTHNTPATTHNTPSTHTTPPGKMLHTTFRINPNSSSNPIYRIPVEPEATVSPTKVHLENASPLMVSTVSPPRDRSRQYSSGEEHIVSPPLPPPPVEDGDTVPEELDFPPPPPEFLLPRANERSVEPNDEQSNEREVISVARVESVHVVEQESPHSAPTKVPTSIPLVKNAFVLTDEVTNAPYPDNRVLDRHDNRTAESNSKDKEEAEEERPEKSSLDNQEENHLKELDLPEVNESEDPLVNRVLSFLSTSQSSQLRKLFPPEESRGPRERRRASRELRPAARMDKDGQAGSRKESLGTNEGPLSMSLTSYLQISPGRASLLNKARSLHGDDTNGEEKDAEKLRNQKEELIERITGKVEELCNNQKEVEQEIQETEEMGRHLQAMVEETCPADLQRKYTTYIGDLEKVTKLLLNLSRKLTKVDSILNGLTGDNKENKENLEKMRENYASRYEDAKHLKESISQRHEDVSSQLKQSLSSADHEDFTYYVGVRSRLLVEAQDITDKIQLGNEQIQALEASLEEHNDDESSGDDSGKDVNDNCSESHIKPFPS